MSTYDSNKTKESLLLRFSAEYIARVANRNILITPTRAVIEKDRTRATVYVSVFPDTAKEAAISFLRRHQRDFFVFLKKEARFSYIPSVHFMFDVGEENRQHIDEITRQEHENNNDAESVQDK